MSDFISLQDISGELSRLRADKAALERKVEELGADKAALETRVGEVEMAYAVLFDGCAVYEKLTDVQSRITNNKYVTAVLDAIIRVQKKEALNSTKELL